MQGFRARLGLLVPSANTTNEPEFHNWLPGGVSLHTARMYVEDASAEEGKRLREEIARCGNLLQTANVDVAIFGCTAGSFANEPGYEEEIENELSEVTDCPAVATSASIRRAFDHLDIESLSLLTPYTEDLTHKEMEFLAEYGIDVNASRGLGYETIAEIGDQHPQQAYREGKQVDQAESDGLFISCTNYRTFEIIPRLEADLGKPVVTSNQATLWDALRTASIDTTEMNLGQLVEKQ